MSDPSPFLSLWKRARDQFDAAFAEAFVITPMIQFGNNRPVPDPNRALLAFQAGYLSPSTDDFGASPGHANNMGQKATSSHPSLIVSEEALPYRPSVPDLITRASNGEVFVVSTVLPDGYGRLAVNLTLRKTAA